MQKNYIKKITFAALALYAIGLTSYEVITYAKANETVLDVDNQSVSRAEVEKHILKENWNYSISLLADELLIQHEAKKLGIAQPTAQEIDAEAQVIKETEGRPIDLLQPKDKAYVIEHLLVKKMAQKYTVDDQTLNAYLAKTGGDLGERTVHGALLEGEHEIMEKAMDDLNKGVALAEVEQKYNLKSTMVNLKGNNEYGVDLNHVNEGDVQHVHGKDHHALLVVHHIESVLVNSVDEKRDVLLQNYLTKEYAFEKVNVVNYLRSQYVVESKEYAQQ